MSESNDQHGGATRYDAQQIAFDLTQEELDDFIQDLIEESNKRAGNETEWVTA